MRVLHDLVYHFSDPFVSGVFAYAVLFSWMTLLHNEGY
jgi:hypothetical protein